MPKDGWHGPSRADYAAVDGGSHLGPVTIGVLHTIEGTRGRYRPGGPNNYGNFGHRSFPHFTVDVQGGKFVSWQHISLRRAGRALVNRRGGVQTNREGVIQIEVMGRAAEPFTSDAVLVEGLGRLMRWIESQTDIPRSASVPFKPYPPPGARLGREPWRMTNHEWVNYKGWCGHQHVPENSHGDPGAIDINRLLRVGVGKPKPTPAKPKPKPVPAPVSPMEEEGMSLVTADGVAIYLVHPWLGARHIVDQTELGALRAAGLIKPTDKVKRISAAHLDALLDVATRDLEPASEA